MNINELRKDSLIDLKSKLVFLYREKLKISFEKTSGAEFNKTHLIKSNKKKIARILTLISERKSEKYD
ncbi:MAG TPA: 50S ribosomal protein L29 [Candidatus Azoamicus sp.]